MSWPKTLEEFNSQNQVGFREANFGGGPHLPTKINNKQGSFAKKHGGVNTPKKSTFSAWLSQALSTSSNPLSVSNWNQRQNSTPGARTSTIQSNTSFDYPMSRSEFNTHDSLANPYTSLGGTSAHEQQSYGNPMSMGLFNQHKRSSSWNH